MCPTVYVLPLLVNAERKKGRVREKAWSHQRHMLGTLPRKPQPHGNIRIIRNGLN